MNKSRKNRTLFSVLCLKIISVGLLFGSVQPDIAYAQAVQSDSGKGGGRPPIMVGVDAVRGESVAEKIEVLGRIVAERSGSVMAAVKGPVAVLHVAVGDRVEKGQKLAELDTGLLRAEHDLYRAALAQYEAQIQSAQAAALTAKQNLARLKRLQKSAAFNQARFEEAQQDENSKKADIARARAQLAGAVAQISSAALNLQAAIIIAPYAGVITKKHAEIGSYLSIGSRIFDLLDDQSFEIEADVPHDRLGGLHKGLAAKIRFGNGTELTARLRAVVPVENQLTRTRAVRFSLDQKKVMEMVTDSLAVNQSVTLSLPSGKKKQAITVAKDSINRNAGSASVFMVEKGKAVVRPVMLGEAVGNRLVVLKGLKQGNLVVIRGNERLRPNQPVRY